MSTGKHIRYQVQHVVPWCIGWVRYWTRTVIFRRTDLTPPEQTEDLYYWVSVRQLQQQERQRSRREMEGAEERDEVEADGREIRPEDMDEIGAGEDDSRL